MVDRQGERTAVPSQWRWIRKCSLQPGQRHRLRSPYHAEAPTRIPFITALSWVN